MRFIPSLALLICLPVLAQPALAADNTQQNKMSQCNQAAAGKKGEERKAFMKTCLSAKTATTGNSQQDRMKVCNSQAAGKKGDERKAFMSACLKG